MFIVSIFLYGVAAILLCYIFYSVATTRVFTTGDALAALGTVVAVIAAISVRPEPSQPLPNTFPTTPTINVSPANDPQSEIFQPSENSLGLSSQIPFLVWCVKFFNNLPRETWSWLLGASFFAFSFTSLWLLFHVPSTDTYSTLDDSGPFIATIFVVSIFISMQLWGGWGILYGFFIGSLSASFLMIPYASSAIIGLIIGSFFGISIVLLYLTFISLFVGDYIVTGAITGAIIGGVLTTFVRGGESY